MFSFVTNDFRTGNLYAVGFQGKDLGKDQGKDLNSSKRATPLHRSVIE
jgi:hypothetical protein